MSGGRKTPAKVQQSHGGALNDGGTPGNRGGPGRLPSAIRDSCRMGFDDRRWVLEEIADGKPVEYFEAPLTEVLRHAECPTCKGSLEPKDERSAGIVAISGIRSARPGDRIRATEALGKYGLGEQFKLEMVDPMVIATIARWKELIESQPTWERGDLNAHFNKIWQASVAEHFGQSGDTAFQTAGAASKQVTVYRNE